MAKVIFMEFTSTTPPESAERRAEIIKDVTPILEAQKRFWQKKILELFDRCIEDGGAYPKVFKNLYWPFHKQLLQFMLDCYLEE